MSDVPNICDVSINSQRYMYASDQDQKAAFGYTSTFNQSINTQGGAPDDQTDFWLQFSQKDWTKGEGQKHATKDSAALFWKGKNVDLGIAPGEVRMAYDKIDPGALAATPKAMVGQPSADKVWFVTSTNLYSINNAGTISSIGAHGVGATPSRFGITHDNVNVYISTGTAGTVGVRRWSGAAFDTFSGSSADSLAFLNNTLYGFRESAGDIFRYDSAGTASSVYAWKDAKGNNLTGITTKLFAFGGKLGILRYRGGAENGTAQLWVYDGQAAPSKVAEFPGNFIAYDACSYQETVFISGAFTYTLGNKPAIMFYKDGGIGTLWRNDDGYSNTTDAYPTVTPFDNGLVFCAESATSGIATVDRWIKYNTETGAFSTLHEASGIVASLPLMAAGATFFMVLPSTSSGTVGYLWPNTTYPTTTEIITSVFDFDTFLEKIFKSITVYFSLGGGTSSVDVSYSTDDGVVFTSLATGITSGEENKITFPSEGTTYRSIVVKVTINRGSGGSPDLNRVRRIHVKAIPIVASASGNKPTLSLRQRTYRLALLGVDGDNHVIFRNGETNPKDGKQQMQDIETANNRTAPVLVEDTLGSYSAIIQKINAIQIRKDEWVAEITCREV